MSSSLGAVYEIEEDQGFEDLGLPTFAEIEPVTAATVSQGLSDSYNGVVSLTIQRAVANGVEILTGIRHPANNETHKDVVSVPTAVYGIGQIARSLAEDEFQVSSPTTIIFRGERRTFERARKAYSEALGLFASHILAIKLDLGQNVESLLLDPETRLWYQNLLLGASVVDPVNGSAKSKLEAIAMLNIGVLVPPDLPDNYFGDTSALYSLRWVNATDFVRGVRSKQVCDFFPDAGPGSEISVCVHGLCLETTVLALGHGSSSHA